MGLVSFALKVSSCYTSDSLLLLLAMGFLVRLFCCIFILGISLLAYVSKHNVLTERRMRVPILAKELQAIDEENVRLQFAIEKFENPLNLMEIARKPEFSHLKHPLISEIIVVENQEKGR